APPSSRRSWTFGPRCWAWSGWGWRTTFSSWAATPSSPPRSSRGCARRCRWNCRCGRSSRRRPWRASPHGARPSAGPPSGRPPPRLRPIPRDGELPLSFGQETFWFLDQLEPGSPVFNIDVAVRLYGPLNVAAVEWAVNEVLRRHEALRTTFTAVQGRPV